MCAIAETCVRAVQWVDSGISVWFFSRDDVPSDITAGAPLPTYTTPVGIVVFEQGQAHAFSEPQAGSATEAAANGTIASPMPGRVVAVSVGGGDTVVAGQPLVTVEAMKMEHVLTAPFAGSVVELSASVGDQVQDGAVLVRLERV